jgi:epoxyqueuosine reductase
MNTEEIVQAWAKTRGYRAAVGGVSLLEDVSNALRRRRESGEIEAGFYRENLDIFTYLEGVPLENPRSIILVAVPEPAYVLAFIIGDNRVETILPPTYVRYRKTFAEVRDDLAKALSGSGFRVEILNAPLKALGNRLGLLSYGRNNVGYIDGLGSYFQLVGLVSDLPYDDSVPPRPAETLLPRCRKCRICAAACPTGAIDRERILLHAEKCYTLFSESPRPIPESLKPPSPKCIIGCLRCQELCPENKGLLRHENAAVSFDAEEAEAFLGMKPVADRRAFDRVQTKFKELGLSEGLVVFRRNLERLLRIHRVPLPDSVP